MSPTELVPAPDADARLDAALTALLNANPPAEGTVDRVRTQLFAPDATADGHTRSHQPRRRFAVSVLIVAAATAVGLIAPSVLSSSGTLQNTAAARTLTDAAAAAVRTADPVVRPGQYLRIHRTDERMAQADGQFVWAESFTTVWIPADRAGNWLYRSGGATTSKPVAGVVPTQPGGGPLLDSVHQDPDIVTACGERDGFSVCDSEGSWQGPTLAWIDALPDDPDDMYDLLSRDFSGHGRSDESSMLVYAEDALHSGLIPADKRAAIYLALARVPGLIISDSAATLDGRTGTAFTVDAGGVRQEVIIDTTTGQYIGNREVLVEPDTAYNLPAGLITESGAVTTAVVDSLGAA